MTMLVGVAAVYLVVLRRGVACAVFAGMAASSVNAANVGLPFCALYPR